MRRPLFFLASSLQPSHFAQLGTPLIFHWTYLLLYFTLIFARLHFIFVQNFPFDQKNGARGTPHPTISYRKPGGSRLRLNVCILFWRVFISTLFDITPRGKHSFLLTSCDYLMAWFRPFLPKTRLRIDLPRGTCMLKILGWYGFVWCSVVNLSA